jgi:signal transduction histidine kinase
MKLRIAIFLLGFLANKSEVIAQNNYFENYYLREVYQFAKLPLDSIWEYHPELKNATDKPDSQSNWQKVNAISLEDLSHKPLNWTGSGWFRKSFTVPDTLQGKMIAIRMGQYGASELYLDGQLVVRYGIIAGNKEEKGYVPQQPLAVSLNNRQVHVWEVHFANDHFTKSVTPQTLRGFLLTMAPIDQSYHNISITAYHVIISASFLIAFSVFFFGVFLFYPKRLASLMAALALGNFSIVFLTTILSAKVSNGNINAILFIAWRIAATQIGGWVVLYLYSLYYGRLPRRSWVIALFMILVAYQMIYPSWLGDILWVFNLLVTIESIRILILGLKNKRSGFLIILIGNIINLIGFTLFIADSFHIFPPYQYNLRVEIGGILTDLNYPLVLALQLALEFGTSNRRLQQQLDQVKKLSQENLEKEMEKQQILANQNITLETQVKARTSELNQSLENLKSTQTQLIHSEKMASLGELTAGIAHEIQNPLNFVNNFSEVNSELIDEMAKAVRENNQSELSAIAHDIRQNLEKINYHGRRADAIVKSMLQHSRKSGGAKEPTDINALADEYLRLSYHGLRAKDSSFNATIKTDFDPSIGNISINPQDIGRVLLNLFNNAFYAVANTTSQPPKGGAKYEPTVSLITRLNVPPPGGVRGAGAVEIRISDNGNGIPQKNLDKIFQPFFTTKPAGQGTGLGLSLSYDIIKAHGGEIRVETKEGEGTIMIIVLPLN